jgi:hypothetical protein
MSFRQEFSVLTAALKTGLTAGFRAKAVDRLAPTARSIHSQRPLFLRS